MAGKLRQIAGKPKKDRYKASSIEKFQTQFANEMLERLNPQIRSVIGKIRDYADQDFRGQAEGVGNFEAMKVAKNIPGVIGAGVQAGVGIGSILGRTMNVNNSADSLMGTLSNLSTASTKGKMKSTDANLMALKGAMGEFDTLTRGTTAATKLATTDMLGANAAKIKRNTAGMNLLLPAAEYSGQLLYDRTSE